MKDVDRRLQKAAESILNNELLTADLDDDAARLLIDWGVAWAQMIAESTTGLDKAAARAISKPRLKATRRMMRTVNRWVSGRDSMDSAADRVLLGKIYDRALLAVSGSASVDERRRDQFLERAAVLRGAPTDLVPGLRSEVEIATGLKSDIALNNDD